MKLSFTGKIRLIIIMMFSICVIQGGLILHLVGNFSDVNQLKMDLQNTIYIIVFLQFILTMLLFFYIPVFLHKAFSEIHLILKEISRGIYTLDVDMDNLKTTLDKEFFAVIQSIKLMLASIIKFDLLKKDKIVEHHNRINALLNLAEDGFIIVDMKGNILYINDRVLDTFPVMNEKMNLMETNFPPELENNLKKYIINVLKSRSKQDFQQAFLPSLKRHVGMKSAIVRDSNGEPKGAVISLTNLDKKRTEKIKEVEKGSDDN